MWAYAGVVAGVVIAFLPFVIKRTTGAGVGAAAAKTVTAKPSNSDPRLEAFSSKVGALPLQPKALPPLTTPALTLPASSKLKVFAPLTGQSVGKLVEVAASAKNLPLHHERWLIVYSTSAAARFFPFEVRQVGADFTVPLNLDPSIPEGSAFKLLFFVTDRKGGEKLRSQGKKLTALPPGQFVELNLSRAITVAPPALQGKLRTNGASTGGDPRLEFNGTGAQVRQAQRAG
jgi:hypothetical protein